MHPQNNKSVHLMWSLTVMIACAMQVNLLVLASGAADGTLHHTPQLSSAARYS